MLWVGAFVVPTPSQASLTWLPLTSAQHWQVGFIGVMVGKVSVSLSVSKDAVLDSGTSLTYLPTAEYNTVIALVTKGKSCTMDQQGGYLICNCVSTSDSSYPTLTLYLTDTNGNSQPYYLTPSLYLGFSSPGQCYVAILGDNTPNLNYWLLGDNFLHGYYQVYDMTNQLIGLASSGFILNNSYSFNNTMMYRSPSDSSQ